MARPYCTTLTSGYHADQIYSPHLNSASILGLPQTTEGTVREETTGHVMQETSNKPMSKRPNYSITSRPTYVARYVAIVLAFGFVLYLPYNKSIIT
jgi:hypothetical protein